jgi:hypothetical protein
VPLDDRRDATVEQYIASKDDGNAVGVAAIINTSPAARRMEQQGKCCNYNYKKP